MYIEINGIRLKQRTLLAIGEGLIGYLCIFLFVALANLPCLRPRDPRIYWTRLWRILTTTYAGFALLSEGFWVQYSLIANPSVHGSAVACIWTQPRLATWAGIELSCLICLVLSCTYLQRLAVVRMVNGAITMHAVGQMSISMLGMYEMGGCMMMLFPMLAGAVGMLNMGFCIPWYTGAWSTMADFYSAAADATDPDDIDSDLEKQDNGGAQYVLRTASERHRSGIFGSSAAAASYLKRKFSSKNGDENEDDDALLEASSLPVEEIKDTTGKQASGIPGSTDPFEDIDLYREDGQGDTATNATTVYQQQQQQHQQRLDLTCMGWLCFRRRQQHRNTNLQLADALKDAGGTASVGLPILAPASTSGSSTVSSTSTSSGEEDEENDKGEQTKSVELTRAVIESWADGSSPIRSTRHRRRKTKSWPSKRSEHQPGSIRNVISLEPVVDNSNTAGTTKSKDSGFPASHIPPREEENKKSVGKM